MMTALSLMTTTTDQDAEQEVELLPLPPSSHTEASLPDQLVTNDYITNLQASNLYISHLLSTWNARTYEFAAIIFTASAYPDTLTASALRGIITTIASIFFSASIGRWIDHTPNRLKTLLSTIAANRSSVVAACLFWVFLVDDGSAEPQERFPGSFATFLSNPSPVTGKLKEGLFTVVLLLGVVEKLSGSANMMSMERDWVVTVAAPDGWAHDLTHLNAVMRRIDLTCKLFAPILLSLLISTSGSVQIGALVVGGMSAAAWPVEWWCAKKVWKNNSRLQQSKLIEVVTFSSHVAQSIDGLPALSRLRSRSSDLISRSATWVLQCGKDIMQYFSSHVWIPSFALSILHLSALSYSGIFITYLLNVGFSLNLITIARAVGSVVEISSTIVTPFGVSYLGKAHHHSHLPSGHEEDDSEIALLEEPSESPGNTETGLERLGLWGITWQLLILIPVVLILWALSPGATPPPPSLLSFIFPKAATESAPTDVQFPAPLLLAIPLFAFLSASRLGLWIYDLTTQQLTQTLVPASSRSSFAGVENLFVSFFELSQYVATVGLNRPDQFRYLAIGSWSAVAVSVCLYAGWVRRERGHLLHWEVLGKGCGGNPKGVR